MYQALYRKWRPKVFSEVVGQEHITDTLRRQVVEGHTAHAYLFTGTRGTGKTTCARILAKAVNCLSPVDGEPCGRWISRSWTPPATTAWIRSVRCGRRRCIPLPC